MIDGGIRILQLRAKGHAPADILRMAIELHKVTSAANVPLIINDHVDIALESGAEGVHVGQDDTSIAQVRAQVGENFIVGKSTHSLAQAQQAATEPINYIGFGPLFVTATKPGRPAIGLQDIRAAHDTLPACFPIYCIGGIKKENLPEIIAAGAKRAVIVSGILQADDIAAYTADCIRVLSHT
jgi:thiamine-phosphate pyrophosphorylase